MLETLLTALLTVVLVLTVAALVRASREGFGTGDSPADGDSWQAEGLNAQADGDAVDITTQLDAQTDAMVYGGAPERASVAEATGRLYSSADVDPLVVGHLYDHEDLIRGEYVERTAHGAVNGLSEYSSAGSVGDVGVDIGPYGLDEYGGKQIGYDDGMPANWMTPESPVRWYGPKKRDYYGPEGATPYTSGMFNLQEPDHDPKM